MIKYLAIAVLIPLLLGCEPTQPPITSNGDATTINDLEYCEQVSDLEDWSIPHGHVYSCEFPNGDRCYIVVVDAANMECYFNEAN